MAGIFRGLFVDQFFEKSENGETIYYPYGIFGRGYVVPSGQIEKVKRGTSRLMCLAFLLVLAPLVVPFVGITMGADISTTGYVALVTACAIISVLIIMMAQGRLLRDLAPVSAPRRGWLERLKQQRTSRPLWTGYLEIACAASMLVGNSVLTLSIPKDEVNYPEAIVTVIVFIFLLWDGAMLIIEKRRLAQQ